MTATETAKPRSPFGAIVIFIVAVLLYLVVVASLADINGSDAAGRGLAAAFASMFGIALWLTLALLLLLAFINGRMPRWAAALMLVLHPVAGVGGFVAAGLYAEHGGWPFAVAALLPPLVGFYALAMRLPKIAETLPRDRVSAAVCIIVALLSLAPVMRALVEQSPAKQAERLEELKRWQAARDEEERQARETEAAAFKRLNPESSLRDYLNYLAPGDARFKEAVAGARLVKTRDADAVALLRDGKLLSLQELWRLDVASDTVLCTAYGDALRAEAMKVERGRGAYLSLAMDLERQLPNIKWLTGGQCNLDEALATLETNVRAVSDSERLTRFADTVAAFKKR